jgi:hypothetical protein
VYPPFGLVAMVYAPPCQKDSIPAGKTNGFLSGSGEMACSNFHFVFVITFSVSVPGA